MLRSEDSRTFGAGQSESRQDKFHKQLVDPIKVRHSVAVHSTAAQAPDGVTLLYYFVLLPWHTERSQLNKGMERWRVSMHERLFLHEIYFLQFALKKKQLESCT